MGPHYHGYLLTSPEIIGNPLSGSRRQKADLSIPITLSGQFPQTWPTKWAPTTREISVSTTVILEDQISRSAFVPLIIKLRGTTLTGWRQTGCTRMGLDGSARPWKPSPLAAQLRQGWLIILTVSDAIHSVKINSQTLLSRLKRGFTEDDN